MFAISKIDDEIVKLRAMLGLVFGIIAYILYRIGFILFIDVSATIWFIAGIVYVSSGFYVQSKYGARGVFQIYIRGIVTFYTIWLLTLFILYDLLG